MQSFIKIGLLVLEKSCHWVQFQYIYLLKKIITLFMPQTNTFVFYSAACVVPTSHYKSSFMLWWPEQSSYVIHATCWSASDALKHQNNSLDNVITSQWRLPVTVCLITTNISIFNNVKECFFFGRKEILSFKSKSKFFVSKNQKCWL